MTAGSAEISVDAASGVPPYEQIRAQLDELIRAGRLDADQRLPPVRQLAIDLGVSPGVVARAYRELEAAGRVRTRRGGGTTVVGPPGDDSVIELARTYVQSGRRLGATEQDLVRALQSVLAAPEPDVGLG